MGETCPATAVVTISLFKTVHSKKLTFQTKYSKKKWENIDAWKIFLKHFSNIPADKGRIGRMLSAPTDAWNPASGG